jgi:hypothetical protein
MFHTDSNSGQRHIFNFVRKVKLSNTNPLKTENELRCSGRVSSSCSTCGTNRVKTWYYIMHARGKDREVFTISGAYPMSFVTQIFRNG